jgi:hypothetical protein
MNHKNDQERTPQKGIRRDYQLPLSELEIFFKDMEAPGQRNGDTTQMAWGSPEAVEPYNRLSR